MAVSENGATIYHREDADGPNHNVVCGPFVQEALSFAESHAIPLDAVAVSAGPGSYTGLRIGLSTAKGVAYGRGVPLITVPTLKVMCVPLLLYRDDLPEDALFVPMIDARRMEVYAAVYDRSLHELRPAAADVLEDATQIPYREYLDKQPVCFFGDGAAKCKKVIQHPNAIFIDDIAPIAKHMVPLAERAFLSEDFADVAYAEPFYLKDFIATKPKDMLASLNTKN